MRRGVRILLVVVGVLAGGAALAWRYQSEIIGAGARWYLARIAAQERASGSIARRRDAVTRLHRVLLLEPPADALVPELYDVMTLLAECASRLGALHLRNSRKGVWLEEFGDGDIDYRQVAAYLKKIGFRGYLVVELAYDKNTEITRPLVESLRLSRKYAEEVFGVKA